MTTSLVYHPFLQRVPEPIESAAVGAVFSILIVTEFEIESHALLVAEQVSVVPVVSDVKLDVVHPLDD